MDNYAKFYLDMMNKFIIVDDQQVVHLQVFKVPDNEGECTGRAVITIKKWR